MYVYKEFEHGVTFSEALIAPTIYPELAKCILSPVYDKNELLEISLVVPPCKAAYTAAYKEPIKVYNDITSCSGPPECGSGLNLDEIVIGKGICDFGTYPYKTSFEEYWCDALKDDWVNFGTDTELGKNVWAQGEPYYCGRRATSVCRCNYSNGLHPCLPRRWTCCCQWWNVPARCSVQMLQGVYYVF